MQKSVRSIPDNWFTFLAASTKVVELDEGADEQVTCQGEDNTELSSNDLQYLLADKEWKDAIVNFPETEKIINRLNELGFAKPSKIQSKTVPFALSKRDVGIIAQSHNGSGKTLGFVLPAVLRLDATKPLQKTQTTFLPQAILIAPTAELCSQILKIAELVAQPFKDIKVSAGRTPAHLIVRTSQGLITSIQKKEIDLSQTDLIVLDEADDQLKGDAALRILQIISKLPKGAGLFFFSATFTKESIDYMNQFFTKVSLKFVLRYMLKTEELKLAGIEQYSRRCDANGKSEYIAKLLDKLEVDTQVIIFANTKNFALRVSNELKAKGQTVGLLMGGLMPHERSAILNSFRESKVKVLITTKLLARGFDQRSIGLVINQDIPRHYGQDGNKADCETYSHRVGRTGKFGDVGLAISLYANEDEKDLIGQVEKFYGVEVKDLSKEDSEREFDIINGELGKVVKINNKKREDNKERIVKE